MSDLIDFWRRNRMLIIMILSFMVIMNLCSRLFVPVEKPVPVSDKEVKERVESQSDTSDNEYTLKSYEEIMYERSLEEQKRGSSIFRFIFFLIALLLVLYYIHRKGVPEDLKPKWLKPRWVSFKTLLLTDKQTERLLMKILIKNRTQESITFDAPLLQFKRGEKKREFKIKSSDFPLTLTADTSHSLIIDIDNFYDKVENLSKYKRIGATVKTTTGKKYKTIAWPKWFVIKSI
ncbi:hypothetical protein QA597_11655 [Marinilabiliaceae bacterium ANBcel2]|nr:hypothetical protein [Marinilabiliaceae bacterium ANBcel2]